MARALNVRYLWIDSICIIQGLDGDFKDESKNMEYVFSSAYCVLAASSATCQTDGFLKPREKRKYLTIVKTGRPPLHICEPIDDFEKHMIDGSLNKRGWVFQERALARRTTFFTAKQTYWECGDGMRCETFTKMNNILPSFMGDPVFPRVASHFTRGGTIVFFQHLYTQYSRLQFTHFKDLPIAIRGLEQRLLRNLNGVGEYGVFADGDGLLRRSLLWHRGADEYTLKKIEFSPSDKTPSWSWMAYEGGIDYLDLPFDGVHWNLHDIQNPWTRRPDTHGHTFEPARIHDISAVARDMNTSIPIGEEAKLVFDVSPTSDGTIPSIKVIVLAAEKNDEQETQNAMHYVLLVAPSKTRDWVYERIGVGYVPGRCIELNIPGVPIQIC